MRETACSGSSQKPSAKTFCCMSRDNLLMVADTENDADMLYAVGMFVPDPFIYLRANGRPTIVMSDLEIDRARQAAPHCRVVSLTRIQDRLRKDGAKPAGSHVFPERQLKSAAEVKKISAALMMAEVGLAEGLHALKNSRIDRKRRLIYHNNPLTSEKLRAIIDTAIIQAGGLPRHTIVAGGRQACDPHERGSGILRAHETIVIDVFPRSQKTGYFGDITRTVVRGRASDAIRKLYDTVGRGQAVAFKSLRDGARAKEVHAKILEFFARDGFKTGRKNGRM